VQEALNTNGFSNSRDSVFGLFTEALVKRFQESKGMRADGVVGPATRTALGFSRGRGGRISRTRAALK